MFLKIKKCTKMWFYPFGNDSKLKEQAKIAVKNRCNWL